MDLFLFVFAIMSWLFLAALWSPVGKGLTSWLSKLYVMFSVFCHFPMRCPGSGLVPDYIDSWSLPSSLLLLFFSVLPTSVQR